MSNLIDNSRIDFDYNYAVVLSQDLFSNKAENDVDISNSEELNEEQLSISTEEERNKRLKKENENAAKSLEAYKEMMNLKEKELNDKIQERNAQIEKLEQLKIRLKNEADELQKSSKELSNKMLEDANKESKKIISDAELRAKEVLKKSEKDGYEKGYNKSMADLKQMLEEARGDIDNAHKYRKETVQGLEQEIINMIISSVNKIIKTKISTDDKVITDMIIKTIDSLNSQEKLIVKISSEDFDNAGKLRDKILALYPGVEDVQVKIVEGFKSGDIEIESESGVVNPSVDYQIKRLSEEFNKLVPNPEEI